MTEQIEVKVYEGTMNPGDAPPLTNFDDLDGILAEGLLPDKLTLSKDRCDSCGAQALHGFVVKNAEGIGALLLMCNHHARTSVRAGMQFMFHRDYRKPFEEYEAERKAQQEKALKELSKKDDSNFDAGTSHPLHLAQWDRSLTSGYYWW